MRADSLKTLWKPSHVSGTGLLVATWAWEAVALGSAAPVAAAKPSAMTTAASPVHVNGCSMRLLVRLARWLVGIRHTITCELTRSSSRLQRSLLAILCRRSSRCRSWSGRMKSHLKPSPCTDSARFCGDGRSLRTAPLATWQSASRGPCGGVRKGKQHAILASVQGCCKSAGYTQFTTPYRNRSSIPIQWSLRCPLPK